MTRIAPMTCARLFLIAMGVAAGAGAWAADLPDAAEPDPHRAGWSTNGDLDLYSDYIARGLTYNNDAIALQGRIEEDSPAGPYAGLAFNQHTVVADQGSFEIDPYAGMLIRLHDLTIDAGAFCWHFPGSRLPMSGVDYDTIEATLNLTYKVLAVKFSYDLLDYFGLRSSSAQPNFGIAPHGSSRGSEYTEVNLALPLSPTFTLGIHGGYQILHNYSPLDYADWRLSAEQSLGHGFILGVARSGTTADPAYYTDRHGNDIARAKWLGYVRWVFP